MSDRKARTTKMDTLFEQMSAVLTALQDNSLTPKESEEILEELHDRCALLRAGSNGKGVSVPARGEAPSAQLDQPQA